MKTLEPERYVRDYLIADSRDYYQLVPSLGSCTLASLSMRILFRSESARGAEVPDFNKNAPPHRPGALDAPELSLTTGNELGSRCPQLFRCFQLNVGGAGGA